MIENAVAWLLAVFSISKIGLSAVFLVSFISATLIPMGSETVVFAVIKANPELFWLAIAVATIGNTLGGMLNYGIGYGAKTGLAKERESRWFVWLKKYGAKTMFLAWLPVVGDPICVLGGWLKLPFWPCVMYMALGKLIRYVLISWALLSISDGFWRRVAELLG